MLLGYVYYLRGEGISRYLMLSTFHSHLEHDTKPLPHQLFSYEEFRILLGSARDAIYTNTFTPVCISAYLERRRRLCAFLVIEKVMQTSHLW